MRDRPINGELETYKFEGLLENVKNRGCSLFTTLSYNDKLYDFTINAVELITTINENTRWYFYVHEWDDGDDCKIIDVGGLTGKDGEKGFLEEELIEKMYEIREAIKKGNIRYC